MTPSQLHILQHALGCDQYGQGTRYRRHFATGPGSKDFADCQALCEQGYMTHNGPEPMLGRMYYFQVTQSGETAMEDASPQPPKLSRARQRYHEFLNEDSGMKFGEWLKAQAGRRRHFQS